MDRRTAQFKRYATINRYAHDDMEPIDARIQLGHSDDVEVFTFASGITKLRDILDPSVYVVCRVNGIMRDMEYVLNTTSEIVAYTINDPEGRKIMGNTAGMLIAMAIRSMYDRTTFWAVDGEGFYCDVMVPNQVAKINIDDVKKKVDELKGMEYVQATIPKSWALYVLDEEWDFRIIVDEEVNDDMDVNVFMVGDIIGVNLTGRPLLTQLDVIGDVDIVGECMARYERDPCQRLLGKVVPKI